MKEQNVALEWFRAKHDELAGTARANLAAHDLETGREAYHLDSIYYATAEQMEAICPTGIDFDCVLASWRPLCERCFSAV